MKRFFAAIFCFVFAASFINAEDVIKTPSSGVDKWYSTGVFCELLVRSYKDTNADKNGDFKGLTSKLDYIKDLGISGLWLMPITDSFERTNNYDPINFTDVDPTYGTLADFKELLSEAHKRDIKIIIDFVVNHTSDQHPYFKDAVKDKKSKYRNWYVFSDTQPSGDWKKYWNKTDTGWYYAYFVKNKPDLNYKNPEVVAYMKSVVKFWLDMGVDGFRFDAVTLLVENGDGKLKNQAENSVIYRDLRKYIDENYKSRDIFTVCESEPPYNLYLGKGNDMFNASFQFKFNGTLIRTVKNQTPFTDNGVNMIESIPKQNSLELKLADGAFYATLLSNHDSYAGYRPYRQFDGDIGKTKLAGALYLTLPGIPFVYYGEELGLDTYTSSKSDKWLRNCMIWDETANFGFTDAKNAWNMINANDEEQNKLMNAAAQAKDPGSILNHYKKIINIRKNNKALSLGDFEAVDSKNNLVNSYLRILGNEVVLVINNFSEKSQNASIDLKSTSITEKSKFTDLTQSNLKIDLKKSVIKLTKINPFSTVILKLE